MCKKKLTLVLDAPYYCLDYWGKNQRIIKQYNNLTLIPLPECDSGKVSPNEQIVLYLYFLLHISSHYSELLNTIEISLYRELMRTTHRLWRLGKYMDRGPQEIVAIEGGGLGLITHEFLLEGSLIYSYVHILVKYRPMGKLEAIRKTWCRALAAILGYNNPIPISTCFSSSTKYKIYREQREETPSLVERALETLNPLDPVDYPTTANWKYHKGIFSMKKVGLRNGKEIKKCEGHAGLSHNPEIESRNSHPRRICNECNEYLNPKDNLFYQKCVQYQGINTQWAIQVLNDPEPHLA